MTKRVLEESSAMTDPSSKASMLVAEKKSVPEGSGTGSSPAVPSPVSSSQSPSSQPTRRVRRPASVVAAKRVSTAQMDHHASHRQAELFYLQKQIQQQTQMVLVLEDGAHIHGIIEWYDHTCIKIRGKSKVLVYKSAIKYLYKAGEVGSAPE